MEQKRVDEKRGTSRNMLRIEMLTERKLGTSDPAEFCHHPLLLLENNVIHQRNVLIIN